MSQRITIQVTNKIAKCSPDLPVVCGNSDYIADFIFDKEWDEFEIKTARFKINNTYTDVVFTGTACPMPIIRNAKFVWVGVFAGDLSTTTPAIVHCRPSILDGTEIPEPPTEDVYNQILKVLNGTIGNLDNLLTNDKSSLVAAVNEIVGRIVELENGQVVNVTTATLGIATIGQLKLGT